MAQRVDDLLERRALRLQPAIERVAAAAEPGGDALDADLAGVEDRQDEALDAAAHRRRAVELLEHGVGMGG